MLKAITVTYIDTGDNDKNKEIEQNIIALYVDEFKYKPENVHVYAI